jgi:hypothetical protein
LRALACSFLFKDRSKMTNTGRKYISYDWGADLFIVKIEHNHYSKAFVFLDAAVRARNFYLDRLGMEVPD